MAIARLGAIELYYERAGQGAPLLFISGTGGDLRVKPNVFDGPLPKMFDLLAYDQRGLGRSAKPDVALLDGRLRRRRGCAAGPRRVGRRRRWSASPSAAWWPRSWCCGIPAKVERLVLACTSPGGAGGASYPFHEIQHLKGEDRARHLIPISDTRLDAAWAAANPDDYARFVAMARRDPYAGEPGREMGARRQLEARAGHDTWDRLEQIRCPVMIAAGRYDGIALPADPAQAREPDRRREPALLRGRPPLHAAGSRGAPGDR